MTQPGVTNRHIAALSTLVFVALTACGGGDSREVSGIAAASGADDFKLTTRAFAEGRRIPARHTCDGDDRSIPLCPHRGRRIRCQVEVAVRPESDRASP
jgi:hypothetical protein